MTLETWLIYLAAGRLITWFVQVAGLLKPLWMLHPLLTDLSRCDLCLGFWVYLGLSVCLNQPMTPLWPWWIDIFIVALMTSLIAHLLRIGWQAKFGITVIE